MKLKKFADWLNENGNAQMGITSIDNPGGFIYNPLGEEEEESNYMFFSNLKRIQDVAKMILKMDKKAIDDMLNSGHDWANDHVSTAKTELEHVFGFFKVELDMPVSDSKITEGVAKTVDLHRQYAMSPTWWAAWRVENEKEKGLEISKDSFSKTYEIKDKSGKIVFVFDYKRNKIFTNEAPSIFILKNEVDSEEMDKIQDNAKKLKDDLAGVDSEKVTKKEAEAEGELETDKTEAEEE